MTCSSLCIQALDAQAQSKMTNTPGARVLLWRALTRALRERRTRGAAQEGRCWPRRGLRPGVLGAYCALPHGRDARPDASPSRSGLARSPSPRCRALAANPSAERPALPIRRAVALRDVEAVP